MRLERRRDPTFPNAKVYDRFGPKQQLVVTLLAYCRDHPEHRDVVAILERVQPPEKYGAAIDAGDQKAGTYGFVYLLRGHPGEYKIGRTNLVGRRLSELGTMAAVEQTLIHEIKTDDPSGVERYWHERFREKRMRGEWFKLDAADVRAFRRWRRIH